jgi:arsenite methyltransferase
MNAKANYGIDSPTIVGGLCVLGAGALGAGCLSSSAWRWAASIVGAYFLLGAAGMLFYSKVGKLRLRERLLDKIPLQGNEQVLDVGCGRGLLTVGAARRLSCGRAVGIDVWNSRAMSGNRAESVMENAKIEGVSNKVETKYGDARNLPFDRETFDVVVSNFAVHEMNNRSEQQHPNGSK